jgi:hypothetical protein
MAKSKTETVVEDLMTVSEELGTEGSTVIDVLRELAGDTGGLNWMDDVSFASDDISLVFNFCKDNPRCVQVRISQFE